MSQLKLSNISPPAAPSSGKVTLFSSGDQIYYIDSFGSITGPLSTGGGGNIFFFSEVDKIIEASGSLILSESLVSRYLSASLGAEISGSIVFAGLGGFVTGSDTIFFVSGSIGSKDGADKGVSVFGGDIHVSGNISSDGDATVSDFLAVGQNLQVVGSMGITGSAEILGGITGSITEVSLGVPYIIPGDSSIQITTGALGQIIIVSVGDGGATSGTFNEPLPAEFVTTASVSIAGGQGFTYTASSVGTDTYFFVSGTVGSKDSLVAGVSTFGGDVHVSGNISADGDATVSDFLSVGQNIQVVGLLGVSGSAQFLGGITGSFTGTMTGSLTQLTDGTSYLVAGTNIDIVTGSNGQVTIATVSGLSVGQYWQSDVTGSIFTTGSIYVSGSITGSNLVLDAPASRIIAPNGALVISSSAGTFITGSLVVSGARSDLGTEQASILFNGDLFVSGGIGLNDYIQLKPVGALNIPTLATASYIYTSGSEDGLQDLYFAQYGGPYQNITRLRWLEGALSTGLLHGGLLSTQTGSTTFSITSGSGIIVRYNATLSTDPYPTIDLIRWPAYVSQSLPNSGSAQITYIGINSSGTLFQQVTPFVDSDYQQYISIGRVLHQTGSVTNGTITSPVVGYGAPTWTSIFTRAIGPLKTTGHVLAASGSTLGLTKTAGNSYVEGRNYSVNPDSPNSILSSTDTAVTVSKIFREHVSGSTPVIDTGIGNAGYTVIDPKNYNLNGTLTPVLANKVTIQRVYWFPNSVNRAFFVYYGPKFYGSLDLAQAAISEEEFVEGANTAGAAILVAYIVIDETCTSLLDTTRARIIQAGPFRGSAAGGGSVAGTTNPGGSNTYVQFNDAGIFGGDAGLTFDKVTGKLTTTNLAVSNIATVSGSVILGDAASDVVYVSGSVTASNGLVVTTGSIYADKISGSLTHLTDGTSYLIAGTNITITTASNGSVTVSSIPNNIVKDRSVSTDFTVDFTTDQFIRVSAAATGTLPNPSTSGSFILKKTGTGTYTINISGSYGELIDGQTYDTSGFTLTGSNATDRPAWTIWSDGTDWWIA